MSLGTLVTGLALLFIVAAIIASLVKRKKAGKSLHCNCADCGCGCSQCASQDCSREK